ncbi:unnamed protein product [Discula destructiva]
MPASSWSSGNLTLVDCRDRSAVKATRAHSAVDKQPVELLGAGFGFGLRIVSGDVDTRLRSRGCMGVMGAELDLRMRLFAGVFGGPSASPAAGAFVVGAVTTLVASPRDFSVAFTTCEASSAFSFPDSSGLSAAEAFFARDVGAFCFVFIAREVFAFVEEVSVSSFGSRRSFNSTVVAGVQVVTEATAALIVSTWSGKDAMWNSEKLSVDGC